MPLYMDIHRNAVGLTDEAAAAARAFGSRSNAPDHGPGPAADG